MACVRASVPVAAADFSGMVDIVSKSKMATFGMPLVYTQTNVRFFRIGDDIIVDGGLRRSPRRGRDRIVNTVEC